MNQKTIRAFIAVELDNQAKNIVRQVQNSLKKSEADVKWVMPENCHLTLKFLGDTTSADIEQIKTAMPKACDGFSTFSITIKQIGAFPRIESPRIIWIEALSEDDIVKKLAGSIEDELEKLGFEKENRTFKSHVTIGRVRSPRNRTALKDALKKHVLESNLKQKVTRIKLFKSTLTPKGPEYEELFSAELKV
jgi:2'-5' RNA ligase